MDLDLDPAALLWAAAGALLALAVVAALAEYRRTRRATRPPGWILGTSSRSRLLPRYRRGAVVGRLGLLQERGQALGRAEEVPALQGVSRWNEARNRSFFPDPS